MESNLFGTFVAREAHTDRLVCLKPTHQSCAAFGCLVSKSFDFIQKFELYSRATEIWSVLFWYQNRAFMLRNRP